MKSTMAPKRMLFYYQWLPLLILLANKAEGQKTISLFERTDLFCGSPSGPPVDEPSRLCTSANAFETCSSLGDPCGKHGLCVRTTEGEPICATDGTASLCFGSEYCPGG